MAPIWSDATKPLVTRKIFWFLHDKAPILNLRPDAGPSSLEKVAGDAGIKLSASNWRKWASGENATIQDDSIVKLTRFFRVAVPDFQETWLGPSISSLEEFQAEVKAARPDLFTVPFKIPRAFLNHAELLGEWLPGLYISYRYSFDHRAPRAVAREILRIWHDPAESIFRFAIYYVSGTAEPGSPILSVEGLVLPVGYTVMMVAASENRARSILWPLNKKEALYADRLCRFGLTTTVRGGEDLHDPVTACTFYIKHETMPDDWEWWCSPASRIIGILPLEKIVAHDFKGPARPLLPEHSRGMSRATAATIGGWVQKFLENTPVEATDHGNPDNVLRLNLNRFRGSMPEFRQRLVDDPTVVAPYKSNWREMPKSTSIAPPHHPQRPTRRK